MPLTPELLKIQTKGLFIKYRPDVTNGQTSISGARGMGFKLQSQSSVANDSPPLQS